MKRFNIVENGYDINEVHRFIDIVINKLEKLNAENTAYALEIDKLNMKLQENKPSDDRLEKAILAVQETADRIRDASREEARIIVEEAKNNANSIIHEALLKADIHLTSAVNVPVEEYEIPAVKPRRTQPQLVARFENDAIEGMVIKRSESE